MLRPVSRREFIKRLRRLGFIGPLPGGRHEYMVRNNRKVFIPNPHGGKDIGVVLLKRILQDLEISVEEFFRK